MDYSKELIQYLKEKPFSNIDELVGKERFVEKSVDPLAKGLGYKYAKYSLMFVDGLFWGEVVEIYSLDGKLDFMVCVEADSKTAIATECTIALGSNEKRMYLSRFSGHRIERISPTEAKQIMERKENTTIEGLLAMNIDIDVYDADTDGIGIAFCGPVGLTEEGRKYFKDVLDYEVEFIDGTYAGDIAVVHIPDNVDYDEMLEKTEKLFYSLAGYCPQKDWDNWFYWPEEDAE